MDAFIVPNRAIPHKNVGKTQNVIKIFYIQFANYKITFSKTICINFYNYMLFPHFTQYHYDFANFDAAILLHFRVTAAAIPS